ncbi:DUF4336 domain-containing protein [Rhodobacterales bacterium HKCCE2091]|nr:DUF4336 domain-containing protein [Rhodobacterales bacterium HKCCE2091]
MTPEGTYPPLLTPKPVADGVWIVDGPEIGFYRMDFPTRMTAIRLASGAMWLHSPVKFSEPLLEALQAQGPIRHLVAPNWIHYAFVADWSDALPGAEVWACPGVAERAAEKGVDLRVDHVLTDEAPAPWRGEVAQIVVPGSRIHREAVFFHRPTSTLILTDLIENFEPRKLPWHIRLMTRLAGNQDPNGSMPRDMRLLFDRDALRGAVRRMIDWGPERVILAHGRWYETGGVAELRRAFAWLEP